LVLLGETEQGSVMKSSRKRLFIFFSILLCLSLAAEMPLIVRAETLTNDLIEQSEASKKDAENGLKSLKSGLTDVKKLIESLETAKSGLAEYIEELDADLEEINGKIDDLDALIEQKEIIIKVTEEALEAAKVDEEEQYEMMKKRIKFMYEKGGNSTIAMLFASESFSDFLNKAEFIEKISKYDREMLDKYIATKNQIAATEERLIEENQELNEAKDALAVEQGAVEELIVTKEEEIVEYENDIATKEKAVKEYEAEIAAQDAIIKELEATILAEKKRLLEQNKKAIVYDGGEFAWPCPGYSRISDDYGMRMHPTLKVEKFHNGIDMAASTGTAILAAYDGEVVKADYSSSMGNYCMIDHGDGLYTIYMHASSISAKEGQLVVRGEQIGKVGSTGLSTGPHLHFSVRRNGEYVNPWSFLK